MTDFHSEKLIDFAAGIKVEDLPKQVIADANACLMDALGCAMFGTHQPWSKLLVAEMLDEQGADKGCSVFGQTRKLPAPSAALCNGLAIHAFELDDLIAASVTHPAAAIIPAALAAAEASNASGARLIEAIVAGYEIMHRVGVAMGTQPAKRGFHTTSLAGPAGAAMAAGMAMGLNREQLFWAVGMACSAAAGVKSFADGYGGGMVKRLHLGRAAEAGVRMAQLARRGFTGPPHGIDSRFGLINVFGGDGAKPEKLSEGLGETYAVSDVWFKVFPICGWIQGVTQILGEMRGDELMAVDAVKSIRVGVSDYAARNNDAPKPKDTMGAQYSIPYCAAAALHGEARDPAMFAQNLVDDPEMQRLAAKVEVYVDPEVEAVYPDKFGARVILEQTSGKTEEKLVLECHGTPADPCSPEEHRRKFEILAKYQLSPKSIATLADLIEDLANVDDISQLTAALVPSA